MKKVLFATSALVASAGFAAADVSISGYAEMGIVGGSDGAVTQFHQDIEVTFSMSGTTDNGLSFGASIQLDEAAWSNHSDDGGTAVFISGSMGTLTLGDTDGGFDWGMAEVPTGSGSIADNETSHSAFSGNSGLDGLFDGQVLRYDHSLGDLAFAVSIELDDLDAATSEPVVGLGLRYSMGDLGLGFGYQQGTEFGVEQTWTGLSVSYSMGAMSLGANYSVRDSSATVNNQANMGIGMSYTMDALTMGINYGRITDNNGVAGADISGFGVSAGYDLGGGASILFGYESTTDHPTVALEDSTWSLGLAMSF
jgi:outer membrane protein OmpU